MKSFKVAAVSFASQFGRPTENLARILTWIEQAATQEVDLVCFPEIAVQGYHNLAHKQAEPIDGPICQRLIEAARRYQAIISTGMALRHGEKVYNAQVFLGPNGPLGFAPKVHLCGKEEQGMFNAGDVWPVIDLGFAKVGTAICYDAEFPEAARCLTLNGAEILLMSFATGRCDSCGRPQNPLCWPEQALRWAPARAYENRIFVIAVNHAGDVKDEDGIAGSSWIEPGAIHHWPGYSFTLDPSGELIAESPRNHNQERILITELDPQKLEYWRVGAGNFPANRRPQTYGALLQK